jgi:hypothetical protein
MQKGEVMQLYDAGDDQLRIRKVIPADFDAWKVLWDGHRQQITCARYHQEAWGFSGGIKPSLSEPMQPPIAFTVGWAIQYDSA